MSHNLNQAVQNRVELAEIKRKYDSGKIDRIEAKRLAQPILDRINARTLEISKRHKMKAYKIDFVSVMRNSY